MSEPPFPRPTSAVDHAARLRQRAQEATELFILARAKYGDATARLTQLLLTPLFQTHADEEAAADNAAQAARRAFFDAMDVASLARALARAAEEGFESCRGR